jgi:hypothetical protein
MGGEAAEEKPLIGHSMALNGLVHVSVLSGEERES